MLRNVNNSRSKQQIAPPKERFVGMIASLLKRKSTDDSVIDIGWSWWGMPWYLYCALAEVLIIALRRAYEIRCCHCETRFRGRRECEIAGFHTKTQKGGGCWARNYVWQDRKKSEDPLVLFSWYLECVEILRMFRCKILKSTHATYAYGDGMILIGDEEFVRDTCWDDSCRSGEIFTMRPRSMTDLCSPSREN